MTATEFQIMSHCQPLHAGGVHICLLERDGFEPAVPLVRHELADCNEVRVLCRCRMRHRTGPETDRTLIANGESVICPEREAGRSHIALFAKPVLLRSRSIAMIRLSFPPEKPKPGTNPPLRGEQAGPAFGIHLAPVASHCEPVLFVRSTSALS